MPSTDTVTVVLADDDGRVLDALHDLLCGFDDFAVLGTASTADGAVDACRTHMPDLAVLDLDMPGGGLTAARQIREEAPEVRVVMFTGHDDTDLRRVAERIGVAAYLLKSDGEDVVTALREVAGSPRDPRGRRAG